MGRADYNGQSFGEAVGVDESPLTDLRAALRRAGISASPDALIAAAAAHVIEPILDQGDGENAGILVNRIRAGEVPQTQDPRTSLAARTARVNELYRRVWRHNDMAMWPEGKVLSAIERLERGGRPVTVNAVKGLLGPSPLIAHERVVDQTAARYFQAQERALAHRESREWEPAPPPAPVEEWTIEAECPRCGAPVILRSDVELGEKGMERARQFSRLVLCERCEKAAE